MLHILSLIAVILPNLDAPAPRSGFAMWADAANARVVVFGGFGSNSQRIDDSWAWENNAWKQLDTNGLGKLQDTFFCFDSARGRCVLFGGLRPRGEGYSGDTWELVGDQWQKRSSDGPVARSRGALAFDEERNVCLLYGGVDSSRTTLGDTWTWDGEDWNQVASGPPALGAHALVYFPPHKAIYLLGFDQNARTNEFWKWDGERWTELDSRESPTFIHSAVAYDPESERIVTFGGFGVTGRTDEMWEWDGENWSEVKEKVNPGHRAEHKGVHMPGQGFYVFGGVTGKDAWVVPRVRANDLWLHNNKSWQQVFPAR